MPILKPISGHGSTGGIRRYLEKGGRALARDLFNLSYDERDAGALGEAAKEACAWDAEMDATRAAFGTDGPGVESPRARSSTSCSRRTPATASSLATVVPPVFETRMRCSSNPIRTWRPSTLEEDLLFAASSFL